MATCFAENEASIRGLKDAKGSKLPTKSSKSKSDLEDMVGKIDPFASYKHLILASFYNILTLVGIQFLECKWSINERLHNMS